MADKKVGENKLPATWTGSGAVAKLRREDAKLLTRAVQLEETAPPGLLRSSVFLISALVVGFVLWASFASFAEKASAPGVILPSSQVQPVQHAEGGIISEVLVREGQEVRAGEILLRLDEAQIGPELDSASQIAIIHTLALERLRAFAEDRTPDFGAYQATYPQVVDEQQQLYSRAAGNRTARRRVLDAQIDAREKEVEGLEREINAVSVQVEALRETMEIRQGLASTGAGSRLAFLEAQRQHADAASDLAARNTAISRAQAALAEARARRLELDEELARAALNEADQTNTELLEVRERLISLEDRLSRTSVRATVSGKVNGLVTERPGLVVGSGDTLMTIVPTRDRLVAEVQLSPKDVGHVEVGMEVLVRVDSYKFGRLGGINGTVERISADTFDDELGNSFYRTRVLLEKDYVGPDPAANRVISGMTLVADIKTGEKSLIAYLARPIRTSFQAAFSER